MSDGNLHPIMQTALAPFMPYADPEPTPRCSVTWLNWRDRQVGTLYARALKHRPATQLFEDAARTRFVAVLFRPLEEGEIVDVRGDKYGRARVTFDGEPR